MAIPWMTVLKLVPWNDVIRNAPQIADAARKLWDRSKSGGTPSTDVARPRTTPATEGTADVAAALTAENTALRARLEQGERELLELQQRVLASSALINQLAEQNTALIARVELNRRRTAWLAVAIVLSVAVSMVGIWITRST
jgi:hypothetical protein